MVKETKTFKLFGVWITAQVEVEEKNKPGSKRPRLSNEEKAARKEARQEKKLKYKDTPPAIQDPSCLTIHQDFKDIIAQRGCSNPLLVIQKTLTETDVDKIQTRLSIPKKKVVNKNFLTPQEEMSLADPGKRMSKPGIQATLIEPNLEVNTITLKHWEIGNSPTYVLTKNWQKVVERNGLAEDMVVQLWSFRDHKGGLGFAVIRLPRP